MRNLVALGARSRNSYLTETGAQRDIALGAVYKSPYLLTYLLTHSCSVCWLIDVMAKVQEWRNGPRAGYVNMMMLMMLTNTAL